MSSDFFWSLKKSIDEELHSLSRNLSDLNDKELNDQMHLRLSRQCDHIQNLFDQISVAYKDLDLDQSNPELYQLLEANQNLNESFGQFNRLRNSIFNLFARNKEGREEEEVVLVRPDLKEDAETSFEEERAEEPEEEESWEEEEEEDPDAENKKKHAERKARQERLAADARKREELRNEERLRSEEQLRQEQRYRQEEAARLGLNVRPDQQFADAELYQERMRQQEARFQEQIRIADRIREENDAIRRTRERLERADRFEGLGNCHIDMSTEGFGYRGADSPYGQGYQELQSPRFNPQYLTPSGIVSAVSTEAPRWSPADSNETLYSSLISNRTETEPVSVSPAFETQMRFNVERARIAYLDAQGTDAAPAAVHEYIQQRNALAEYQNAVKQGTFFVSSPSVTAYSPTFDQPAQPNSHYSGAQKVITSLTPTGTVSETIENGVLTGNRYEFTNPGLKLKPAYSATNPMVVSEKYEQALIDRMEQAKETLNNVVANGDIKAPPVDPMQLKMYTDAYLAFQKAKRDGTVVVSSSGNGLDVPDYVSWQQIRRAQTSKFSDSDAPFTVTGHPQGANPNQTSKKTVEETVSNIFNQKSHLKQQSIVSMYASQIGSRFENFSYDAFGSFSRQMYRIAQSGEDNSLHTMEEGRYYVTTAAGVVLAIKSGSPTHSLAQRVGSASSKEFQLFGTKSFLSDSELSAQVNNGLRLTRELDVKISDIENKLVPMNLKMEQYIHAHPGSRKLDGLDKFSQREYEQLSSQLSQLRADKKAAERSLSLHSKLQQMRHESQVEAKLLDQLKGEHKHLPRSPKALQNAAKKVSIQASSALEKKYGALTRFTDESLAKEIALMKQQGRDLKKQIQLLQAKGSALTASERKLLLQLKGESKDLGIRLGKFAGLSKDRAELLLLNKKLDSLVSAAYKNSARMKGGIMVLQGFMVRALQSGVDSNTDGLAKVLQISSNRYVHILAKKSYRAAVTVSKVGLKASINLVSPGSAEAISEVLQLTKAGVKAKVGTVTKVTTTAIKTGVKTSVKTAAQGIATVVPDGIKTGVKSGIQSAVSASQKVTGKYKFIKKRFNNVKNRISNSIVGRTVSAASRGAAAAKEAMKAAFAAAKALLLKAAAIGFCVFLVIGVLTSALTMLGGGVGGSVIAAPNSDKNGKIDLSPYVEYILKEEQSFQNKINALVSDDSYDNVFVNYASNVNNTKHILSMMAVRLGQELDIEESKEVSAYLKSLYHDSHTYSTSVRKYNCAGCKDRQVQKTERNPDTGKLEPVYRVNEATGEKTPVMVTEKYCDGHKDLTVTVSVLTFDDIFTADSTALGSISLVGSESKEKVWNFLKEKGLDDVQAAAIMGNIQAESGFDSSIIEHGNGIGFGLCQWSFGRRMQLERFASSSGVAPSDLGIQLQFFWAEFSPDAKTSFANNQWIHPKYTYKSFMATDSIEEATRIFCFGWERPAEEHSHINTRIHSALTYYNMYSGTDASDYEKPEEGKEEQKEKVFEWDKETIEWCKLIYNMKWSDLYSGVFDYGGVIETGELIVSGNYMWPVSSTNITSPFGYRTSPTAGASTYHKGVDIGIPTGTPVHSVADGVIIASTSSAAAGKYVIIDHGNGVVTKYMHNSVLCFNAGDKVSQGDVIAYSGSTGISTGPHLHFEFVVNGTPIDPCLQFGIG